MEAAAMLRVSGVQTSHLSQESQQVQPGITRMPRRSVLSKNSSRSILPSSRMVFIFISFTYARSVSRRGEDHRRKRSGAQAAPRIKILRPLILKRRLPWSVSWEVTSRTPKVTVEESETVSPELLPPTRKEIFAV